jgi:hypothetical protein
MFFIFTYEAAGASVARLSLRPLFRRDKIHASLGRLALRGGLHVAV